MKKSILFIFVAFFATFSFSENKFVASTSWTAAFADLAGVDDVVAIAPANLRHPPEYEITVSDIQKINESDYFVYAGFERMMKTLGSSVGNAKMIQIACNNSIATIEESTKKIAELAGTEKERNVRVDEYVSFVKNAASELEKKGFKNAKVLVNKNQRFLASDLGSDVSSTFGPEPVTSEQILDAKNGDYILIIDNVHNPVGKPLSEVAPNVKYIAWRNFPEKVERNALLNTIKENVQILNDSLNENVSSFKMKGLLKDSWIEFGTKEVYVRDNVYFVDIKKIVPANTKHFKKSNKVRKGDVFLDASNKIVMFLDDETYSVMKGTKLGRIKDVELFKKILSEEGNVVRFEN